MLNSINVLIGSLFASGTQGRTGKRSLVASLLLLWLSISTRRFLWWFSMMWEMLLKY